MATLEELQKQVTEAQKQVDASSSINYRGSTINLGGGPTLQGNENQYQGYFDSGGRFRKFNQHPDVLAADQAYRSNKSKLADLQTQYANMQAEAAKPKPPADPPMKYDPVAEPARPPADPPMKYDPVAEPARPPVDTGFELGPQVVVYGPDGTAYGNPQAAIAAGVTNYTMTPPAEKSPGGGSFEYSHTNAPMYEQFKQSDFYKDIANTPGATVVGSSTIDGKSYSFPMAMEAEAYNKYMRSLGNYNVGGGKSNTGLLENPNAKYMGGFRQPGDMGMYVAFNDPGQPGEGFANAEEYEAALNLGKKNMAATDTPLKGKTGKELEEAVLQRQAEQADSQAMTPGTTIDPELQKVQNEELLTDSNVKMATVTAPVPATIDPALYNQTAPVATAAKTYEAANVIQPTDAQAARGQVSAEAIIQAQQGALSADSLAAAQTETLDPRATTQFQLAELFKSLEDGKPLPAWAAPAVRNVTAIMQQRGLGSSSMAAAATMQALMESGVNIANQDAQKYATIQLQNLNNKQQAELQNATALANMDMANLNNRQQAAVNNAKTFLAIDVQNLTNEQQSKTIDYQAKVNMMLSDQAAKNAASQFNAKSDNEINMFFEELGSQIESASKNRAVSVAQFNVNQRTAMDQFNASMSASREQFNSNMQSTINQSNANWRRQLNTANTASQNAANQQNAQNLLTLNQNSLNNLWQLYRDQAAWTMQISENNSERAHNAAMLSAQIDANSSSYDDQFNNFLMVKTVDSIFKSL